jgi:hypothetical protein
VRDRGSAFSLGEKVASEGEPDEGTREPHVQRSRRQTSGLPPPKEYKKRPYAAAGTALPTNLADRRHSTYPLHASTQKMA